ncbi:MAG: hypothetical protein JKY42_12555, partial [Flavobacteriales bacterium]|nr:hypothetical protein [Flavobacteriales bacterium]
MTKFYYSTLLTLFISLTTSAQNTWDLIYTDMQTSCAFSSCHANGSAPSLLDLEGFGASAQQDVYNNLVNAIPTNSFAAGKGYKRVYPGDPYRSSLFRKICGSLDDFVQLDSNEGGSMPATGTLDDKQKELIRQWILFGAPETGSIVDTALIAEYYNGNSIDGVPTPIVAPNPAEGYQIKLGPFFLEPQGEIEYYLKYNVENMDTVEIHQVDIDLGQLYSHHFITYRFRAPGEGGLPAGVPTNYSEGLRLDNAHSDITFVTANQQSSTIDLPDGTGFRWLPETVLDLNTHYINYDLNKVLKCENFINIYTQPSGTAVQLMETDLYVNSSIAIPATNQDVQFTNDIFSTGNTDDLFYWMITSHTHKLGIDFDVCRRDAQGNAGDQIFDAAYIDGDPNGTFVGYDYQHPPVRYWEYPFLPVQKNLGLKQIATFNNNTGQMVFWGDTSDDEMMITMAMFVDDTTGLGNFGTTGITASTDETKFHLFPNPARDVVLVSNLPSNQSASITFYN